MATSFIEINNKSYTDNHSPFFNDSHASIFCFPNAYATKVVMSYIGNPLPQRRIFENT